MQHPYLDAMFITAAIAFMALAILASISAWTRIDDHLEDRRERRLDAEADRDIRKQLVDAASNPSIPGQRESS